jgi:riboflavin kinase/FMN adenylyltransferase
MDTVAGIEGLRPQHGPMFAVVGVFDGLHLGHAYLLEQLVREAAARDARPTVITFDHHPDEILTGVAPPLLLHPAERIERLADAGVAVTVVVHFDDALRHTTYDRFIESIRDRTALAGLLMTPDAAFGYERRGTPEALATLGARDGFDVVVVPPFTLDGRSVRSSDIRAAIGRGDLAEAAALMGRRFCLSGDLTAGRLARIVPMATPPDGRYGGSLDGRDVTVTIDAATVRIEPSIRDGHVRVELTT